MATINSIVLPAGWTKVIGVPTFNTTVLENPSGLDVTVPNWQQALWFYTISYRRDLFPANPVWQNFNDLWALFLGSYGGAFGFLVDDVVDNTDSAMGGTGVVVLDGSDYRLAKQYSISGLNYYRYIRRPKTGVTLSGVSGSGLSISATTGIISGATSTGTWAGGFYIPMRFMDDGLKYTSDADGIADVTCQLKEDG